MYRVVASNILDIRWLNGFKKLQFPKTVSEIDKQAIVNLILSKVSMSKEDWLAVRNYGGVFIENFNISDEQYEDHSYKGSFSSSYFYEISCDVVVPEADGDRVEHVEVTYNGGAYHRNTFSSTEVEGSTKPEVSASYIQSVLGEKAWDQLYNEVLRVVDDEVVDQYGGVDLSYETTECRGQQEGQNLTITTPVYSEFRSQRGKLINLYAEVESVWDGQKFLSHTVTHFSDEVEYE